MNKFKHYFIFILFLVILFPACNDLEDVEAPPETLNSYLVDKQLVESYPLAIIKTLVGLASVEYSQLAAMNDDFNSGVEVYKIIYNTTFNGEKKQASGLVCIPTSSGDYPILSYHNGTNTLHSKAPSVNPNDDLFRILEVMASTGFIVSLPDYLGFGEADDMFHPYLHKESTVNSVADMLYAVEEMVESMNGITFNKDLYLSGYSQGGWTTLQLQKELETTIDHNFNLKAGACGAGPYSLISINEYVTGISEYGQPYFLGYLFNSFLNLGMTTSIDDVFQAPYAEKIPDMYDGTMSGSEINNELTTTVSGLFTADYLANWQTDAKYTSVTNMLESNSVSAYNTNIPTMILHGTEDALVPKLVSDELYQDFMSLGVSPDLVHYEILEGETHTSGIIPSGLTSIQWFLSLKE